ncbi:MAG: MAPEG family protein [Pseudomonadota bacterium]
MEFSIIAAMTALLQYLYFGVEVGRARGRTGVPAPAVTGNEEFERTYRAHLNTAEQLVMFLPALFASAWLIGDVYGAVFGVVFVVGRAIYFRRYVREPGSRGPGMLLTAIANLALMLGGLVGAIVSLLG